MAQPALKVEAALESRLEDLRGRTAPDLDTAELVAVVKEVLSSLSGEMSAGDVRMYQELKWFVDRIERTKSEIAALRPETIHSEHIPQATDELGAIVSATENATNEIMEAAEGIEAVAEALGEEQSEALVGATTRIYEACSFQDITGQRIRKVVTALKEIESKVSALIGMVAPQKSAGTADVPAVAEPAAPPADAHLLNGPQLPGEGHNQAAIDALFDK
ncbi:MAG: protein phosphatase CheZ [Rhodospirillales bacterium]